MSYISNKYNKQKKMELKKTNNYIENQKYINTNKNQNNVCDYKDFYTKQFYKKYIQNNRIQLTH